MNKRQLAKVLEIALENYKDPFAPLFMCLHLSHLNSQDKISNWQYERAVKAIQIKIHHWGTLEGYLNLSRSISRERRRKIRIKWYKQWLEELRQ